MIEESTNFEIAEKELKDATIDLVVGNHTEEPNHIEESCIEDIQDLDISYGDLVIYEDENLTNFEIILEIKQQSHTLGEHDAYRALVFDKVFGASINFEATKFKLLNDSILEDLCGSQQYTDT